MIKKYWILIISLIILGVIMADTTSSGQRRIQSNDGQVRIGITERELKVTEQGQAPLNADQFEYMLNDKDSTFLIVDEAIVTIPGGSAAAGATTTFQATPIDHELGVTPIVISYETFDDQLIAPWGGFRLLAWGFSGGNLQISKSMSQFVNVDDDQIIYKIDYHNGSGSPVTVDPIDVQYYVLLKRVGL